MHQMIEQKQNSLHWRRIISQGHRDVNVSPYIVFRLSYGCLTLGSYVICGFYQIISALLDMIDILRSKQKNKNLSIMFVIQLNSYVSKEQRKELYSVLFIEPFFSVVIEVVLLTKFKTGV